MKSLTAARLGKALDAALALPPQPRIEAAGRLRAGDGLRCATALIEARIGVG